MDYIFSDERGGFGYNDVMSITKEIEEKIASRYLNSSLSCNKVAKEFGLNVCHVYKSIKKSGNVVRNDRRALALKYTCNENYFEKIDSEAKAYWLGFLYADGCNSEDRGSVKLALAKQDIEIVERFKKDIEFSGPIKIWVHKHEHEKNNQDVAIIAVVNYKMSKDLARIGCFQRKTFALRFPTPDQVPDHLIRHFIRGYFDGDGCFCAQRAYTRARNTYKQFVVSIVSTEDFCIGSQKVFKNKIGIDCRIVVCNKKRINNIRRLIIPSTERVFRFLDWIYFDANIYLKRKFDKYRFEREDLNIRRAKLGIEKLKNPDQNFPVGAI